MNITDFKIVADSSADLTKLDNIDYAVVPMRIMTNEKEYVDNIELNVEAMVEELYIYDGKSTTACPGMGDWLEAFGDAKYIFCVTITSGLSGSYNSAQAARREYEETHSDRHVFVIDSLSAGPELMLIIEKLRELIIEGREYNEICTLIKAYQKHTALVFTLESLKNFSNNGRISPILAKAVGFLNIRIVGKASRVGQLEPISKPRGEKKALLGMIEAMQNMNYNGAKLCIGHCFNEPAAIKLKEMILEKFEKAEIKIYPLRGLCSFYAEKGGILIGFECR